MIIRSRHAGLGKWALLLVVVVLVVLWTQFSRQAATTASSLVSNNDNIDQSRRILSSTWPWIPRKVWQTASTNDQDTRDVLENSWHKLNPTWRYELLNDDAAETFINETFAHSRPDIVDIYHRIETPIIKVDLLRYLILLHDGGLYADVDVDCMKPMDAWLPEDMRHKAGMVLGIEYDDDVHKDMPSISLAQYIFMARPGHPILQAVVEEALKKLEALGDRVRSSAAKRTNVISAATPDDILEATGPYMFSRVVFENLEMLYPGFLPDQLHLLRQPILIDDVVILPINGFGWGQEHSRSGELDMGEVLAEHHFRRSWRNPVTWDLDFSWSKDKDP